MAQYLVIDHLLFASVGSLLPSEKSLVLLLGDGYIAGAFLTSLVMPGLDTLGPDTLPNAVEATKSKEDVICGYVAIITALVFAAFWTVGRITDPHSFPIVPSDHDLFGSIPAIGIGAMLASAYAFVWGQRYKEKGNLRWSSQRRLGERKALLISGICVAIYFGIWLNLGAGH
jgi:hypothetical protein